MKNLLRLLAIIIMIGCVACTFSGCIISKSDNQIVFATNAEFPPFESIATNGVLVSADGTMQFDGIDMLIAKRIAESNGKVAIIYNTKFESLIDMVKRGQVDACIAGITINADRLEEVDFSIPYYSATQVMVIRKSSDVKSVEDIKNKRINVVLGYTGLSIVQKLGYDYKACKTPRDCFANLVNGVCDVIVIDSATAQQYVSKYPDIKIVEDPNAFETEEYGIAVQKGNTELLDMINREIEKMLKDGTIDDYIDRYSG